MIITGWWESNEVWIG